MDEQTIRQEMEQLREQIRMHNYSYHVLDAPTISDAEFDRLLVRLKEIEEVHPDWITPDSPTQRSGAPPADRFVKVRHPRPVLSLANAFDLDGVRAWYDRLVRIDERVRKADFVVEPKIDGLTVVLHYENGQFLLGATRGDGLVGEDVTHNLRTVKALPLSVPVDPKGPRPPQRMVVRGEVFITIKAFERLNQRLEEAGERTYLNPRNTAAGSLRQLDPALTASRPLRMLVYWVIEAQGKIPRTQWETLEHLRKLGFPVPNEIEHCPDLEATLECCQRWAARRDQLSYEADGVVIKINDRALYEELGVVGKDPRGAIALKFPAREVTTQLKDIIVNVGRTGVLTPNAVLEPVEIGGVIVGKATLHNFDYIADKDIRIGDRVMVKRSGDVIPYIIGPILDVRHGDEQVYQPPETCPTCGTVVEHLPGEVAWYCPNLSCPAQLIRNLEHFVSRGAMDINGLGIRIVRQLVASGLVRDVADLFRLTKDDLLTQEGFAEKKADNLIAAIDAARNRPFSRVINALGIRGVGEVMAADLAERFRDLNELQSAALTDLMEIEGVGPNIAESIEEWFNRPQNLALLEKLRSVGVWPEREVPESSEFPQSFEGQTFVVTGTLPGMTRDEVRDFIQQRGGKVTDSVSKKTSYVVVGENPGSKLEKAEKLGVPVIDQQALETLAEGGQ